MSAPQNPRVLMEWTEPSDDAAARQRLEVEGIRLEYRIVEWPPEAEGEAPSRAVEHRIIGRDWVKEWGTEAGWGVATLLLRLAGLLLDRTAELPAGHYPDAPLAPEPEDRIIVVHRGRVLGSLTYTGVHGALQALQLDGSAVHWTAGAWVLEVLRQAEQVMGRRNEPTKEERLKKEEER